MKLIIATGNPGKLSEILKIIATFPDLNLETHSIKELNIPEPPEPHDTFMENAKHKAKYYADQTRSATLSEDSGFCVEALNGFPGVKTKDFVAEVGGIDNAYAKIAEMLKGKDNLRAEFMSAATIYLPQENRYICYEDKYQGTFTYPKRGTEGFSFDPVFIPEGYTNTMAELGLELKNKISHRARAMRGLLQALREYMHSQVAGI